MNIALLREAFQQDTPLPQVAAAVPDICKFAGLFLSTDPITPEWLREKWGFNIIDMNYAQRKVTDARGVERILCWYGGNQFGIQGVDLKVNQGQFTALMFSLGQCPKE